MSLLLGIDPGVHGAIVVNNDGVLDMLDMPTLESPVRRGGKVIKRRVLDEDEIATWIAGWDNAIEHAYIEQVSTRPGEGGASAFGFGLGFGLLRGILVGLSINYDVVPPQTWTKALDAGADKRVHRQIAARLFPEQADLFRRAKDDGRADAALITAWAVAR